MKFLLSLSLLILQHTSHASGFANVLKTSSPSSNTLRLIHRGRGGNTIPKSYATNVNQYDASSDDEDEDVVDDSESTEVDLVTSRFADIAAQNAKKMSNFAMDEESRGQQSKSYFLSAALWSSLALDTILNKKKRSLIIPGVAEVGGKILQSNLAVTASLTSGFLLSAGLAFFLSRDLSGDDSSWDEELKTESMRKMLHVLLFIFGVGNLCANINPASAPFLGLGGFVINTHNALIALNGWIKESSSSAITGSNHDSSIKDLLKTLVSMPRSLFRTANVSMGFRVRMMSSLYMACGVIAGLRCFDIISNSLVPHYLTCFASKSFSAAPLNQLQTIGLKWAALSRTILAGGTCVVLKEQVDNGRLRGSHAKSLGAIISICALAAGVPAILSNSVEYFSSGFKLVIVGLITGVSSVM